MHFDRFITDEKQEFSTKTYWKKFYKQQSNFEWYGDYTLFCELITKYARTNQKNVLIGCGNSLLSVQMFDIGGYRDIDNIDTDDSVVKQMRRKYRAKSGLKWTFMDATRMSYEDESIDAFIDKGTVDAIMSDHNAQAGETTRKVFSEVSRCLKPSGRFICISLAEDFIATTLLNYALSSAWAVRVHAVAQPDDVDFALPVFVFVFTKMKTIPGKAPLKLIEFVSNSNVSERLPSSVALLARIHSAQQAAVVIKQISHQRFIDSEISLELCASSGGDSIPRFRLFILDQKGKANNFPAVFIVPPGRESEWLYGTPLGRRELHEMVDYRRLILVHVSRPSDSELQDPRFQTVQEELSPYISHMTSRAARAKRIPFLTVSDADSRFERVVRERGFGDMTGEFIVEDVRLSQYRVVRRLIFTKARNEIQSEVELTTFDGSPESELPSNRRLPSLKSQQLRIDHARTLAQRGSLVLNFFAAFCFHYNAVLRDSTVLLVGLGGGVLAHFLDAFRVSSADQSRKALGQFSIGALDVVELDPVIVEVARRWFGFDRSGVRYLTIDDGSDVIQRLASLPGSEGSARYDFILWDVDAKTPSCDSVCAPPASFLTPQTMQATKQLLKADGVLVVNTSARAEVGKARLRDTFQKHFDHVSFTDVPTLVNQVYAMRSSYSLVSESAAAEEVSETDLPSSSSSTLTSEHTTDANDNIPTPDAPMKCEPTSELGLTISQSKCKESIGDFWSLASHALVPETAVRDQFIRLVDELVSNTHRKIDK